MKNISFVIIFCFWLQGCASATGFFIGDGMDNSKVVEEFAKNKTCNFEEVLSQKARKGRHFYTWRLILAGSILDLGLSVYYLTNFNPNGLTLFAAGAYTFYSLGALFASSGYKRNEPPSIDFAGWYQRNGTECKEEYFTLIYNKEYEIKTIRIGFLKAILNYPHDYDISQDENFTNFQKDFLRNNKIQTYSKDNYFYRYIHYPGGKAKFEEDFGKYLFKK